MFIVFSSGEFIADFSHNTLLPPPPSNSQSIWEVSLGCPGPLPVLASRPAPLQVPLLLLPSEICAGDVQELWFWWCESTLWWHACVCRGWYSVRECMCVSRSAVTLVATTHSVLCVALIPLGYCVLHAVIGPSRYVHTYNRGWVICVQTAMQLIAISQLYQCMHVGQLQNAITSGRWNKWSSSCWNCWP